MLSSKHRLRKNTDILAVLRTGRQFRLKGLKVYIKSAPDQGFSRVACVVGKKVSPLATRRHSYQRLLRVLAKEVMSSRQQSVDIVFVAQPDIEIYANLSSLREALQKSLS